MSLNGVIHPGAFVVPATASVAASEVFGGRTEIQSFAANAIAIAVGDWVMMALDATGTSKSVGCVVKAAAGGSNLGQPLVVGVALDASTVALGDGQIIRVVTSGYVASANVADAVTAGQALSVLAVAGRGSAYAATGLSRPCGVALADGATANTAPVWVFKAI